jgi:uncharacterized protein
MKTAIKTTLLFIFLLGMNLMQAQDIPPRPNPPRLVNDFTGTLSKNQVRALEQKLVHFNDTTSNQITIVMVNSFGGYDMAQYAYKIGEVWKVGQGKFDNGIVILVKPKTRTQKGQAFIASGYGLEGAIPDAICKRIVENELIPSFRNNNYYGGLEKATTVLMQLAAGEFSSEEYKKGTQTPPYAGLIPIIIIIIVMLLMRSGRNGGKTIGRGGSSSLWTALFLGSMLSGGRGGGGFGGGSGGFGGGGGGFGGFGGGSFGGGGAGGSW